MRIRSPRRFGNAAGDTTAPPITPAFPYEVSSPGPRRSTRATATPRLVSWSATEVPTIPAPRTIASVFAIDRSSQRQCPRTHERALAVLISNHVLSPARTIGMIRGDFPAAGLVWLGRQGTRAVAASLFLALAFPSLAAWCKPIVPEAIFALLILAFLRVNPRELRGHFAEPTLVLVATMWTMLIVPAGLGVAFALA